MGLVLADDVREPASNTGSGPWNMSGTASGGGYVTVLAGIGDTNNSYFVAWDPLTGARSVFKGTVTNGSPVTLSVDKTLNNGGAAVAFTNAPIIWCDFPAYLAAMAAAGAAQSLASNAGAL